ncbi:MAG: Gfo/Idh/MocA family oxidoreductase [Candidatus Omnitrophota bacterium]|nr:Gfo/Idh/MocA family oxidoreductase [Candidatus Omnitrophota bacterium]
MSRPLRIGLIGAGRWGRVYLRTLRSLTPRMRLAHLGARHPERAGPLPARVVVHQDWRRVIRADCDAVIIATPAHTHAAMLQACLEARKPCIVEKPLCLDVATAERLDRRVRSSGVPVLVNHTHLFSPAYRRLKQALASGREHTRVMVSEGMDLGPFRRETSALWDWGPHDVSLCLDLLKTTPVQVDALGGPKGSRGTPEVVSLRLGFSGGVTAWIHAGCLSPRKRRTLSVFTDRRLYVWDDTSTKPLTVRPFDFSHRYDLPFPEPLSLIPLPSRSRQTPMEHLLVYFADGLQGGDRRYFGTTLALAVVRVLARCESAMEKRSRR